MRHHLWELGVVGLVVMVGWAHGMQRNNITEVRNGYNKAVGSPLFVGLTLIPSAAAKGAVCMDGSLPGYHLHRGFGSGANSWLVNLEGGGWCNNLKTCLYRKKTRRGSSHYMEKQIEFTGILSDKPGENPGLPQTETSFCSAKESRVSYTYLGSFLDFILILIVVLILPDFYNWNRVKVRYCDGASFTGEGYDKAGGLYFRGQRIWLAAMEDLMSKGMRYANQALLSGCSAGGLAAIQHCDEFRSLFPRRTKVKCLADAGMFLDAVDVAGRRTLRSFFRGVVNIQGAARNLPRTCTFHSDATSCFFPQNVLANIQTPLFLLNTAYDVWQLHESLAPKSADPHGYWQACKLNHSNCSPNEIHFLQGFRNEMLNAVKWFSRSKQNGLFINSCFAHCQTERQDTWYGNDSPWIGNKGIAKSVGDWYFDRSEVKAIDCPYPCDKTCHHLVFRKAL